jgi:hypothetical protein
VTIPAAAKQRTPDGAKAFAQYYLETYSEAAHQADAAVVVKLSDPSCGGCKSLIDLVEGYRAKGQRVDRVSLTVDETALRPEGTLTRPVVDALAKDARKRILNRDGSVASNVAAANINFRLTLVWSESGWKLFDLKVIQ